MTSMGSHQTPGSGGNVSAAGPASGRYGGFGSEDIARLGYGQGNKFDENPHDPYTKGQSAPSQNTFKTQNTSSKSGAAATDDKKKSKKSGDTNIGLK